VAIGTFPVIIVGCGPGSPDYLTPVGRAAIEAADVLVGAPRLLELFPTSSLERIGVGKDVDAALKTMEYSVGRKRVVVLVTGDPGLYSLAKSVIRRFGRSACRVIPGVSSMQTAFARIGLDWEDACILSLHGKNPDIAMSSISAQKKIAILIDGETSRSRLKTLAGRLDETHEMFICSDLTLDSERVDCIKPESLAAIPLPSRSIILFVGKECLW